jgi:hypothetical protein
VVQYECVLDALDEFVAHASGASVEAKARANGLLHKFKMSSTLLALRLSLIGFSILEIRCKALQGKSQTVSGMLAAVDRTLCRLQEVYVLTKSSILFTTMQVLLDQEKYDLDPFVLPRPRRAPKRVNPGGAEAHVFADASLMHRVCYFTMLDVAHSELKSRFDQDSFIVLRNLSDPYCLEFHMKKNH